MSVEQDLHQILDQLEDLLDEAAHIPFSGRVVLDSNKAYEFVDRLRKAIPEGMQQAQRVIRERDRILQEAREEGEALVKEAQAYAEKLTRESAIAQRAEEDASRILEDARRQAREVKMGARQYAGEILEKLDVNLNKCVAIVRQGLDELGPGRAFTEDEKDEETAHR